MEFYWGKGNWSITTQDAFVPTNMGDGWLRVDSHKPASSVEHVCSPDPTKSGWGIWVEDKSQLQTAIITATQGIDTLCDEHDAKNFEYPEGSGIFYKTTDAILKTINYLGVLGITDSQPLPINNGCWDNVAKDIYNPVKVVGQTPMTLGELKELYSYGYQKAMYNYGVCSYHKNNILTATSVDVVEKYDYSVGWK